MSNKHKPEAPQDGQASNKKDKAGSGMTDKLKEKPLSRKSGNQVEQTVFGSDNSGEPKLQSNKHMK